MTHQMEDNVTDEYDDSDPDRLVQCPYDKNHQIRATRFPFHIIKCAKNHPKLARSMKTCPFNASHVMPHSELEQHEARCPFRRRMTIEPVENAGTQRWQAPVSTWSYTSTEEDWDTEADYSSEPFIWGKTTMQLNNRSEPSTCNSLNPGVRAPKTLPWNNSAVAHLTDSQERSAHFHGWTANSHNT